MTLDLTQFHAVFFDEAAEHLATMESLLLYLDEAHPDPAQLEDLRRAAHSLKGSAATFGFGDLAMLATSLEETLSRSVRQAGPLPAGSPDAVRDACRELRRLLASLREDKAGIDDAARARAQAAGERLRALAQGRAKVSAGNTAPAPPRQQAVGVMALIGAVPGGSGKGLEGITQAVRALNDAIDSQAEALEDALDENQRLREELNALVAAIATFVLSAPARNPTRPRPVPKLRRTPRADKDDPT